MKLYIMKREALETLKSNMHILYGKYYTEKTNGWITEICGENPLIEFKEVPDFELARLDSDMTPGEIDLANCKILYEKLQFLSESQAGDERLWAGLTHSTFYEYMRNRWGYSRRKKIKSAEKESGAIITRFFYKSTGRNGFYRNTLSKCWWVGHNTFNPENKNNHFESLDIIGSNDINSKITEFFYNFTFSSNPNVMAAIIDALRTLKEAGKHILVRDHIRPAMSYLNAVGGSVIIDCLAKEEITSIFEDAVEAIMQGDVPTLNVDNNQPEEVDYSDDSSISDEDNSEPMEVVLGCKVVVRNSKKETRTYKYDLQDGDLTGINSIFTGRKVGDTISYGDEEWEIIEIRI